MASIYFVTGVRHDDIGQGKECRIADVVRSDAGFETANERSMNFIDVASLIVRGDQVFVWSDDGQGGSTHDELVRILPGQIEHLTSTPQGLIHRLPGY